MENLDLFNAAALITAPSLEAFARAADPETAKAAPANDDPDDSLPF